MDVLKIKTIQKVEKQKQYISEKVKKNRTVGENGGISPFGGKSSCLKSNEYKIPRSIPN